MLQSQHYYARFIVESVQYYFLGYIAKLVVMIHT